MRYRIHRRFILRMNLSDLSIHLNNYISILVCDRPHEFRKKNKSIKFLSAINRIFEVDIELT
jgi:hypothetical protein